MSDDTPKNALLAGMAILAPVLEPYGFVFEMEERGESSGGWFASGAYRNAARVLELHFRYSLGLVTYRINQDSLDHETYMRLLGVYGINRYPDFPKEPLESFHHLAADIENHCKDFTCGDGQQFRSFARTFAQHPMMFKGIS